MTTTQKEEFFPIQNAQKKETNHEDWSLFLRRVDKKDATIILSYSVPTAIEILMVPPRTFIVPCSTGSTLIGLSEPI